MCLETKEGFDGVQTCAWQAFSKSDTLTTEPLNFGR